MRHLRLWLEHPQNLWLRRAVFQLHFWTGLILGTYFFLISVTGSVLIFRTEIYDVLLARTKVSVSGEALTHDRLVQAAQRTYPGFTVQSIRVGRFAGEATDVSLSKGWRHKDRVFDPYVGRDIGPSVWIYYDILHLTSEFHANLLMGDFGIMANGIGGFLLALMALSGLVVWWPGISKWRGSIAIRSNTTARRFNWNLHSVIGFWTAALILMWGLTGASFIFPQPFQAAVGYFTPIRPPRVIVTPSSILSPAVEGRSPSSAQTATEKPSPPRRRIRRQLTRGEKILQGFSAAHYGTFGGWPVKALWVVLGLAPTTLFVTGLLMWWNRSLRSGATEQS